MAAVDLVSLAPGERVQQELIVRAREDKTTKNGDPFAVLLLGNASGQISANIWKEQLPWIEGVRVGSIVQTIGAVESYQGRRQLKLTAPLRVIVPSAANLDEFLPRIAVESSALWDQVDEWRSGMRYARLRAAVDLFFADDEFRARLEKAPAAPGGHHAKVGGLLMHIVEVGTIARGTARTMQANVDLITAGALLHDIGRVEAYVASAAGFGYTQAGYLLQHTVIGSLLLDRRLRMLPPGTLSETQELELHHFIQSQSALPEHGVAVPPMTLEAELLHWADQASANGDIFHEAVEDRELFPGREEFVVRRSRRLDRNVWRRTHSWE